MLQVKSRDAEKGFPDVGTLSVIPITATLGEAETDNQQQSNRCGEDGKILLLPKLSRGIDDESKSEHSSELSWHHHPCGKLIRTSHLLQNKLHERLKDASNGALNNAMENPLGKHEEFLQRCDAVIKELLDAIQQHLRKQMNEGSNKHAHTMNANQKRMMAQTSEKSPPPLSYYAALLRQLQMLHDLRNVRDVTLHVGGSSQNKGKEDIPADVTRLSVTCVDGKQRSHTWHADLYPTIVLTIDLPEDFTLIDNNLRLEKWWENDKQLVLPEIQHRFQRGIETYQLLFDELDDLDSHLWILDPSLPARRCNIERRIALWEGGASMFILLDPEKPRAVPVLVRFVGVTAATMVAAQSTRDDGLSSGNGKPVDWSASFADFVAEDAEEDSTTKRWSEARSIRENLELWFGAPLPSPLSTVKSDYLVECGICYTHRLPADDAMADDDMKEDGALPDVKCSNSTCNRHYHDACLFEWLHSLPTAKTSFDRIYGSCPYCCETVSVRLQKVVTNNSQAKF